MSPLKKYWIIVHYETEYEAENTWDACHEIRLGNTIVENATIIAEEIPPNNDMPLLRDALQRIRLAARREAMVDVVLRLLAHSTCEYAIIWERLQYFDADIREKIQALSVEQLERLSLDVLAFSTVADFARHVRGNAGGA